MDGSPSPSPGSSPSFSPQLSPTSSDDDNLLGMSPPAGSNLPVTMPSPPPEYGLSKKVSTNDPTMKLSNERVEAARNDNSGRVYRVYCDGVFDLFHLGHARVLEQAKRALGDPSKVFLLAGVCNDEDVHRYKGKTVMDHKLRCESVRHCRWVDEVLPDAPWVIDSSYLKKHRIDFVAHDAIPYQDNSGTASDSNDVYAFVKKQGMFLETQRTEGLSTSDIIVKIIRDYDEYVIRNLDRGYTKRQLNIGKSWEMRARWHENERKVKESVNRTKENVRETQDAALAFISEFNPKYLLRRNSANGQVYGPRYYMHRLKKNLPARRNELWHHSIGLARALFDTSRYILSYLNPCGYCCRAKKYE